ncbi:MAG: DUF3084 domain-containing protein [Halanaerobiales bacterium]|nr:DUF3084 domain-containing protein [Halanaerobiales bacterium]
MLLYMIFALIVVSGLIAYLGDQIGMKIGKKRLSIFGIRPKYTSIIITILTGILIATISIALLMIGSEGVRTAVFDMEEMVAKLGRLNQQVSEKEVEITDTQIELEELKEEKKQFYSENEELQLELDLKKKEYQELEISYMDMEISLVKAQDDYYQLNESKIELDQKIIILDEQKAQLEDEKANIENELPILKDAIETLESQVNGLIKQTEDLTKKNIYLILEGQQVKKAYENKDIVYQKDDLIYFESLKTIPDFQKQEEILDAMNNYIVRANKALQKNMLQVDEMGLSLKFDPSNLIQIAEALLDPKNEKILVGIFPKKNTLAGEFLEAIMVWEPNYKIYESNEIVIQKEIDSDKDITSVQNELNELLEKMSQRSIERGLFRNVSGGVGKISFPDFYLIVEKIKTLNGKVKIIIQAKRDIWRQETLSTENLRFDVSPVVNLP